MLDSSVWRGLRYGGEFCGEALRIWCPVWWGRPCVYGVRFCGEAWGMVSRLVGRPEVWCPVLWGGLGYGVQFGGEAWCMVSTLVERPGV